MTLTFETDLYSVRMNRHNKYLGHRLFSSKVIVRTHSKPDRLLYLEH